MAERSANETRAVLAAYRKVKDASWPDVHPEMAGRAKRWPDASEAELRAELEGYLKEASAPACPVRVFWKLGAQFVFGGCNLHFASDAGLRSPAEIVGLDDFSPRLPWRAQADKYRADEPRRVRRLRQARHPRAPDFGRRDDGLRARRQDPDHDGCRAGARDLRDVPGPGRKGGPEDLLRAVARGAEPALTETSTVDRQEWMDARVRTRSARCQK